jgi:2-hydroxy-6-oxonona-2,4-dienedioate hydrolase
VRRWGSGRPVVLVHGLAVSSRYLVPTGEQLGAHVLALAPDLPGFGRSRDPAGAVRLRFAELVDELERWCAAEGLDRAAFLGNSLGCQLIVELALRRPDLVEALVLVGPTGEPGRGMLQLAMRLAVDAVIEPVALDLVQAHDYVRYGLRATVATAREMVADPIEEKLPRVAAPTLVVRGSRDAIVSQAWCERAVQLLPRARLEVVRGAAHAVNWSHAGELARLVLRFLDDAAPAPSR